MNAVAEAEMFFVLAGDVQLIGRPVLTEVAVGGAEHDDNGHAPRNELVADFEVFGRETAGGSFDRVGVPLEGPAVERYLYRPPLIALITVWTEVGRQANATVPGTQLFTDHSAFGGFGKRFMLSCVEREKPMGPTSHQFLER